MKYIIVFVLSIVFGPVSAQKITISAKVQDKVTGEALSFASVGIKGKSLGTITNLQGEFDFHFPAEYRNEILVISMLGYLNYEAPVWTLLDGPGKVLMMEKSSTILQEVVVTDSLTGGEVFKIALARIERNYPMEPFLLDGFYRDVKKVGGTHIALLEAAVKIYDENYLEPRNKSKLRERVKLIEVRKSLGYENRFTPFFGQNNLLEDLLLHNNIRYRQIDEVQELFTNVHREPDSYFNNHKVYVLSYAKDFNLQVFIDKEDYSIIHLELEQSVSDGVLARKKSMVSKFIGYKKIIDFKRYNGKMYLNYITINYKENWHDQNTDELKFQTELVQSLLINEIHANTKEKIGPTEKMRNYGLQYQDYPYNKTFWDNYNVIKETPLDKEVLNDLEKIAPLEVQFQEN